MPAGLDSGAIGFAAADSVGPGDGDTKEDAEDAAQHLAEDNKGDVRRQNNHSAKNAFTEPPSTAPTPQLGLLGKNVYTHGQS